MKNSQDQVWFVYDGKCPICQGASNAFALKKTLGTLNLIDARTQQDHVVMKEIQELGLNLDEGMVIKFNDNIYHGSDALHIMALIGTNSGIFNRLNYLLFRSKTMSKICYPIFKSARNFVLWVSGISKIND